MPSAPGSIRARRILSVMLGLTLILPLLSACQVVGVLAYKLKGPPTIQAVYTPPSTPMLILAENFDNPSLNRYEAEQIAWQIGQTLEEHEVVPLISPDKYRDLAERLGDAMKTMSLSDIGHQLGASQILYVNIHEAKWESLPGTRMVRGHMSVWVKIIDVDAGETRWPATVVAGHPMSVKTDYTRQDDNGDGLGIKERMCHQLGQDIARLFYKHKADE